jgi:manganese/iron transport system ATP-binding protein
MPSLLNRITPHQPGASTVTLKDVTVSYNGTAALDAVSFSLEQGEQIAVVGPNGAGKSTLFNVMVGKVKPDQGDVRIYGSGPKGHICIGYVPQRNVIDWRFPVTVRDVVMMGRTSKIGFFHWPRPQDRDLVEQAMLDVHIADLADRQIGELSGGQQQRVFLARALAQEAELLLLDEPFTGLDLPSQKLILEILGDLRARKITILVATHDLNQAADLFDRIMLINRRLIGDGPPAQVLTAPLLRSAYGSHLHVIPSQEGMLVVADTCCEPAMILESEHA